MASHLDRILEMGETLDQTLQAIGKATVNFPPDAREWVDIAVMLNRQKQHLDELNKMVVKEAAESLGDSIVSMADGTQVEVRVGAKRKQWQHKELLDAALRRVRKMSTNFDTGETITTEELVERMFALMGVGYWKVKELTSIGIDANDYCDVQEGNKSLMITRSNLNE